MSIPNRNDFIEKSDLPDDFSVEPLYAVRKFIVNSDGSLSGLSFSQPIVDGINVAQCGIESSHAAPQQECQCGWYAYDDTKRWWGEATSRNFGPPKYGEVKAVVKLSGRIIVCERGLKAEEMEVVAVAARAQDKRSIDRAGRYPHLVFFKTVDELLEKFPVSLLPDRNPGRSYPILEKPKIKKAMKIWFSPITGFFEAAAAVPLTFYLFNLLIGGGIPVTPALMVVFILCPILFKDGLRKAGYEIEFSDNGHLLIYGGYSQRPAARHSLPPKSK